MTPTRDATARIDEALARADDASAKHVFIQRMDTVAQQQADASARRHRQGVPTSSLDGMTVVWKDLFDIIGTRTTAGSRTREAAPLAARSAPIVEAANRAGLITIGKTNLSEFAFSGVGYNPHFGTPIIPHQTGDRAPGGSSSGSAVAVRHGIADVGFGTDTAGSIRVPAAFNGLVGYRASQARYDRSGIFPLAETFDTAGPIARTVQTCVDVDGVLRAHAPVAAAPLTALSFIVDTAILNDEHVADAVKSNLVLRLRQLAHSGARVTERSLKTPTEVLKLIAQVGWPGGFEAYRLHRETLASPAAILIDPRVAIRLRTAGELPSERYQFLLTERHRLQHQIKHELDGANLVIPTVAHAAPLLAPLIEDRDLFAKTNLATLRLTMIASFLDMPSIAMPTGLDAQGLSTSMTIARPQNDDDRLLASALAVEQAQAHSIT